LPPLSSHGIRVTIAVKSERLVAGHFAVKVQGSAGDNRPGCVTAVVVGAAFKFASQRRVAEDPVHALGESPLASEVD
jgi:hypothetical protein